MKYEFDLQGNLKQKCFNEGMRVCFKATLLYNPQKIIYVKGELIYKNSCWCILHNEDELRGINASDYGVDSYTYLINFDLLHYYSTFLQISELIPIEVLGEACI